jgi:hypothetical protein
VDKLEEFVICFCYIYFCRKLINLLRYNFRCCIAPNNIWCFDELILPFHASNDPLVAFIPRKPHPQGILAYLAAIQLPHSKLPFLMDILPVTSIFGLSGPHAVEAFMEHLPGDIFDAKVNF